MLIKTSDLSGAALDWAVAKAAGLSEAENGLRFDTSGRPTVAGNFAIPYKPSVNWNQCGPLLDKYVTALNQSDTGWRSHAGDRLGEGASPLIAACRAIVAAELGDTVEVPDELLGQAVKIGEGSV